MEESPEQLMSQALLEKLEPLIHTIESQLRDLGQGQVILQGNVAQLSSEINMTQAELDKVHDTFARLPHYIAKLTAMKNTIATVSVMSRKLKRRAEQVAIGREKQNNKAQAARAREQAYDQTIAAFWGRSSRDSERSLDQSGIFLVVTAELFHDFNAIDPPSVPTACQASFSHSVNFKIIQWYRISAAVLITETLAHAFWAGG
ncbi:hypothetical protein EC957_005463 [Mortierella hygrophila]|uniref:Biogenesis of lysosome-related organelles complex 1 subunit 7 n=1 Tax=Mortierella hygrophila TaxID=979708 RepID=A0A9P6F0V9_9FUNG|nr:hypothetical protein EC957_005463 [Mortierella hygrophila]